MKIRNLFILKNKTKINVVNSRIILSKTLDEGEVQKTKVSSLVLPKVSFDLNNNKVFVKKILDKDTKDLNSFFENFKLLLTGDETFYFVHLTITGLGFRIRRYVKENICFLRIELGYSHFIYYPLPDNVFFLKGRKKCLLYSNDFNLLKRIVNQVTTLRKTNPYKEKGLLITGKKMRKKSGKQDQK